MYKQINHFLLLCLVLLFNTACGSIANQTGNRPQPVVAPPPATQVQQQNLRWSGELDITNAKIYRKFLRDYGICDQWTFTFGTFNCASWDGRSSVAINFHKQELPSQVNLTIWPVGRHWLSGSIPFSSLPINIIGNAHYINDFDGFQARFTGRVGLGALSPIIAKSPSGSVYDKDRTLEVDLFYGGSAKESFQFGSAELENPTFADDLDDQTRSR